MKKKLFILIFIMAGAWFGTGSYLRKNLFSYTDFSSLTIQDRRGVPLRVVRSSREGLGEWTPYDEIPSSLIQATLALEDKRFWFHPGVDPIAIFRAMGQNFQARRVVSGGSTLTQQLVRVVRARPRTLWQKTIEAGQSVLLETVSGKKEILAQFLNRAPYGNQTFGVAAAAQFYFGKPPQHLTLAQSAFLAGLPQAPTLYNPHQSLNKALNRQRQALTAMRRQKRITEKAYQEALAEEILIQDPHTDFKAPHFVDYVLSQIEKDSGKKDQVIRTTLDYQLQKDLEGLLKNHIRRFQRERVSNGAALVLDNKTGEVLAWVGSADYFNEETQGQVNGVTAPRQPGSTWKPFVYGLALEMGYRPSTILPDIPLHAVTQTGDFTPQNYDEKFHGPTPLRTALACSYNVPVIRVMEKMGPALLLSKLQSLGFSFLTQEPTHYGLGLGLGGAEASLAQLTQAYAALANKGLYQPFQVLKDQPERSPKLLIAPDVAFLLSDILSDDGARAPAFGSVSALTYPFACAVKTGTSKNYRDAWTIGFTPDHTVGVWVGNFKGEPMKKITGAVGAAPLVKHIFERLYQDEWPKPFKQPAAIETAQICPRSGLLPGPACPGPRYEKFLQGTVPKEPCSVHQWVRIDVRNGLLAHQGCPQKFVRERQMETYDPIYRLWAGENNIDLIPVDLSPLCQPRPDAGRPLAGEPESADLASTPPLITYPDDGDVFVVDPVLRREYQTLLLTPHISGSFSQAEWLINDEPFATVEAPFTTHWPIQEGQHVIKVRVRIGDRWETSAPVTIQVL